MVKSQEELKKITDECYEICDNSYKEDNSRDFFDYVDDYLLNSYPELTSGEMSDICETIEDIVNNENNISKGEIIKLVEKYKDCTIEELYENHESMGNWCIMTCDLKERRTEFNLWFDGGIFGLVNELKKYTNIKNLECETMTNEKGFYEYVSFEWC